MRFGLRSTNVAVEDVESWENDVRCKDVPAYRRAPILPIGRVSPNVVVSGHGTAMHGMWRRFLFCLEGRGGRPMLGRLLHGRAR